jgi:hypothetical protein
MSKWILEGLDPNIRIWNLHYWNLHYWDLEF